MLHGDALLFIVLGYFIIVVVFLTILWRIATAIDTISSRLSELTAELKHISSRLQAGKKDKE